MWLSWLFLACDGSWLGVRHPVDARRNGTWVVGGQKTWGSSGTPGGVAHHDRRKRPSWNSGRTGDKLPGLAPGQRGIRSPRRTECRAFCRVWVFSRKSGEIAMNAEREASKGQWYD
jgi:hypothetical protein